MGLRRAHDQHGIGLTRSRPPTFDGAPSVGAPRLQSAGPYQYLCVGVLALAYTFNFLDRQLLALLAEPVKRDLHLSDGQLGLLTGFAFALFYTLFGLPIARLADRSHRVRIVALACTVWSLFSAGCGLAGTFLQLAVARVGVGVGEAGGATPSYAIISDLFPRQRRGAALALYSLGVPCGTAVGAALGGGVAAHYGWRAAFFAVGLPGVLIALLILAVVREPVRGGLDPAALPQAETARLGDVVAMFFRHPVLRWTALGTGLFAFAGYGMLNWTPAFLMRHQHMTLAQLSGAYSLCVGGAMGVGTWASGWLGDRLALRRPRAYATIPLWGALATLPFAAAAFLAPSWQLSLICLTATSGFGILYLAPALAVVQNAEPPQARSTSAAILLFVLNLVGLGGGPVFVGVLSDLFKASHGGDALKLALLALLPILLLTAVVYLMAARAMDRLQA
jgi:MFS family permease